MTLPETWSAVKLGNVARWSSGGTPQAGNPMYYNGDIPWAVIGDLNESTVIQTEKRITQDALDSSSAKVVPTGAVLLAMYGASIGRTGIAGLPMATNQAIATAVVVPELLDARFLLLYLQSQKPNFVKAGKGGAQPNISQTIIKDWDFPLPPLAEQRRIVQALDDHLSRLDKALAESQYAAKATMRFSTSLLHSMFTGDLMQRELGIEDINVVELSEVAEIQSGGTPKGLDRLTSDVASESHTIPFYKVGDMNLDSRYMLASRAYLTSADVEKLSLKVVPVGSVIFPKAGGAIATDKKRLVKVPGPIDLNCMAVTPSSQLLPSYLAWWFESFKLSDLSNGSILPQIGKTSVMQVRLPCPSLSEQEHVVHYLEENITQVRAQAQNIDGVAASIETLRRSILNDAFSGKLVNGYSNEQ